MLINAENLKYIYKDDEGIDNIALDGVSINIKEGEFVAVLGHNGSGKSTLATHFNAIKIPTFGDVYVCGMNTKDEDKVFEIRSNVGMVFQNPDNQIVATVVEEDVAFALENMGVEPSEIRRRVDDALRAVNMYEFRTNAPHLLSGGQKQRIAIAGIIAIMPKCVVLDEPTAMLDPYGRREVINTILFLCKTYNISAILITHHMDEAAKADRVIIMNSGKIVKEGTAREIFTEVQLLKEAGLDVPATVELLYRINKELGENLPIDALTIEECADVLEKYLEAK